MLKKKHEWLNYAVSIQSNGAIWIKENVLVIEYTINFISNPTGSNTIQTVARTQFSKKDVSRIFCEFV